MRTSPVSHFVFAEDAWSGEEYFCETPNGFAKFVRPSRKRRFRYDMREVDPLEA